MEVTDGDGVNTQDSIFVRVLAPTKRLSVENQSVGFKDRLYDTNDNEFGSAVFNRWRRISKPAEEFLKLAILVFVVILINGFFKSTGLSVVIGAGVAIMFWASLHLVSAI